MATPERMLSNMAYPPSSLIEPHLGIARASFCLPRRGRAQTSSSHRLTRGAPLRNVPPGGFRPPARHRSPTGGSSPRWLLRTGGSTPSPGAPLERNGALRLPPPALESCSAAWPHPEAATTIDAHTGEACESNASLTAHGLWRDGKQDIARVVCALFLLNPGVSRVFCCSRKRKFPKAPYHQGIRR